MTKAILTMALGAFTMWGCENATWVPTSTGIFETIFISGSIACLVVIYDETMKITS